MLLHPTCLPASTTDGTLGSDAFRFVDWLTAHGQSVWQILPVGPPGFGGSPYSAHASHAGDPSWVSRSGLVRLGLLEPEGGGSLADARRESWERHRRAPTTASTHAVAKLLDIRTRREELEEWGLYAALKERYRGASWVAWPSDLRARNRPTLKAARHELRHEISYHLFLQAMFEEQWSRLHRYAADRGVDLFGDLPLYPALDSVDVWCHRELFHVDDHGHTTECAGVPPDDFTDEGQLWGQPTFRWAAHATNGYRWWNRRVSAQFERFDLLRLDHFRGLVDYWAIPATAATAAEGSWKPGPGRELFDALTKPEEPLPLVAEDLGVITPQVEELRRSLKLPGMRVLQFALDADSPHRPERIAEDHVVYTGTHDNPPTRAWYQDLGPADRRRVRLLTGGHGRRAHRELANVAFATEARLAILPLADVLGLRHEAIFNRPGTLDDNWNWKLSRWPRPEATEWLNDLTSTSGRGLEAQLPRG